jgi:hypothetical protein
MSATSVREYLLFLLNCDVLGMLSWALQFNWLINGNSDRHFAMASFHACVPVVFLNLFIQRRLIFGTKSPLFRFLLAQLFIMASTSFLSPVCRTLIELIATREHGDKLGFALASIIGSVPSFLFNKSRVFRGGRSPKDPASAAQ